MAAVEPVHAAGAHLQRRTGRGRAVQQVAAPAEQQQQLLSAVLVLPAARAQRQRRAQVLEQRGPRQLQPPQALQRRVERVKRQRVEKYDSSSLNGSGAWSESRSVCLASPFT